MLCLTNGQLVNSWGIFKNQEPTKELASRRQQANNYSKQNSNDINCNPSDVPNMMNNIILDGDRESRESAHAVEMDDDDLNVIT